MPINILSSICCKEYFRNSEFLLNTLMMKTDKFVKRKCYNIIFFVFFNILTMKISSYYQIVFVVLILWVLDYCIRRYILFFLSFLLNRKCNFFYLFLFPGSLSISLLLFYGFLNKALFPKGNSVYDWYIIYPHFLSYKKINDQNVATVNVHKTAKKVHHIYEHVQLYIFQFSCVDN